MVNSIVAKLYEFFIPKFEKLPNVTREGVSTLSQISAFLGALLFSAFLFLTQNKTSYQDYSITIYNFQITEFDVIAIPLIISTILFVLAAYFLGISCCETGEKCFQKGAEKSLFLLIMGFVSFFISFIIVLFVADILICIIGGLVLIGVTYWMFRD